MLTFPYSSYSLSPYLAPTLHPLSSLLLFTLSTNLIFHILPLPPTLDTYSWMQIASSQQTSDGEKEEEKKLREMWELLNK